MEFTEANNQQMQERVKDKINRIASMKFYIMEFTEDKKRQMQAGVRYKINRIV
jgi:hypothetical protein